MKKQFLCAALAGLALCRLACAGEVAEVSAASPTFLGMDLIASKPLNEVWIDSGFLSYHYNRNENLNGDNYGLGADYRFSTVAALTAGRFNNSNREYSDYLGVYYQPLAVGPFRIGAVAGGFNGYPNMKNGNWFFAAVPMISGEWDRVDINLAIIPTLQNRLYGAISLQIKIRVWD